MSETAEPKFHPVILGPDIGTYALARSFNDEWGMKPTVIAAMELGPIANSSILDPHIYDREQLPDPNTSDPNVAALLQLTPQIKAEHPGKQLLLIANTDGKIWEILNHREALEKDYVFALPDAETISTTNDKGHFAELARKYGLAVPPTLEIRLDDGVESIMASLEESGFSYPLVLKPCYAFDYEMLKWEGKRKVYMVDNQEQMEHHLRTLIKKTAGVESARRFVIQPRIDGNDTHNLLITAYVDRTGAVTMLSSAHVLIEDHAPSALGNPAAMITEPYPELYQQVERFLTGIGWHGFANFDLKVDKNTGIVYFFEINPRIGRSCYYNTLSGLNPMPVTVDDIIEGRTGQKRYMQKSALYTIIPLRLLYSYVDDHLVAQIKRLKGRVGHPLLNPNERHFSLRSLKRELYVRLALLNHYRKYRRNYPVSAFRAQGAESYDTTPLRGPITGTEQ
ncbi:hypothetical protein [Boudabousia marimammalium]|uniref:ATP-grasp domain-containing protein n=1 Tax=Boudabousia marimammalium TaxID=156892 RepID=A0A1Q5PJ61_9ACTO|nr:hypothetical protein [Boudabousia marimammalium]OKL45901.1 hypothetical protein BM477_07800 [Boudabousia marimammalium]